MDRRMFLSGLFSAAGAAAFGGLMVRSATAAPPIAPLDLSELNAEPDEAQFGRTPDGTEVDQAHYTGYRHSHRRYRRRRRPHYRRRYRRSRVVCRNYRTRYGRWVRRCRRVYYW